MSNLKSYKKNAKRWKYIQSIRKIRIYAKTAENNILKDRTLQYNTMLRRQAVHFNSPYTKHFKKVDFFELFLILNFKLKVIFHIKFAFYASC